MKSYWSRVVLTEESCPCRRKEKDTQQNPEGGGREAGEKLSGQDHLLSKHEELSSNSQNPHEKWATV